MREKAKYMATVGTFDGVHRGHISLLTQLRAEAEKRGLKPLALTLDPHPRAILDPEGAPALLSVPERRNTLITSLTGIEARSLSLSSDDLKLTAEEFLHKIGSELEVGAFMMGFNNHIGSDRRTGAELAASASMPVVEARHCPDGAHISSSAVRRALTAGDVELAADLLGHPYVYTGRVGSGKRIGRTIGFPTANIEALHPTLLLPAAGVYAVTIKLPGEDKWRPAMANIGRRPTVEGNDSRAAISLEVYILDYAGDLYDSVVDVAFVTRLRDERRFGSLAELQAQLAADEQATRAIYGLSD